MPFVRGLLILILLTYSSCIRAQTVRVLDGESGQPIPYVLIYTEDQRHSVNTNLQGSADLTTFSKNQRLFFRHPTYTLASFSREQLAEFEFTVALMEDVVSMKEVVVSASKWEQDLSEVPNKIISIKNQDINFSNPQTAADLLDQSGQVFVQKSQMGGGSPMIRGFAANRVLIVVDGVRMNNAIFRGGNLQNVINIDPNILEGAEVLFGPGSVIYGSGALGGVMDFHLKDPLFLTTSEWETATNLFSRYSSANNEFTIHLDFNVHNDRFSSLTSFTFSNFGDLRAGSNRKDDFPDFGIRSWFVERKGGQDVVVTNDNENFQIPSAYSQHNLLQKLNFKASDRVELGLTINYSSTSDIPRYDRLIEQTANGDPRFGEWYYGPQTWLYTTLRAKVQAESGLYDKARIILGYQLFEESRNDRLFNDPELRIRNERVDAYTLNLDLEKRINETNQLFYGMEFLLNQVGSNATAINLNSSSETTASTRYPDGGTDYGSFAMYASYKKTISQNFHLTTGLRYSQVILQSRIMDTSFFDFTFDNIDLSNSAINGSFGFTYKLGLGWQWNGLISSGFRAPNLDDVGKIFDSEPGVVVVPNPDLQPEFSYNFETSISKVFSGKTRVDAVIYYSLLRDAMVRRPFTFGGQDSIFYDQTVSRVEALINTGKAYVFGGSINILSQFHPDWMLRGAVTYTEGQDQIEKAPLRHTTPVFGYAGVTFTKGKFRSQAFLRFNGPRRFTQLPPSEQNKTHLYTADGSLAWYTINTSLSYTPNNHVQITTSFENLLDTHYRPYSSGISAPGFNWLVGIRGSF